MGEQLLFRQMALTHISPGLRLLMADCIIRIEQVQQVRLHKFAPESFPLIHLSIIEPGLVEPGAPLLIL